MDETAFGRYRLLGSLGEGGMGQVFRAYDTSTDREVALKVLAPHVAQDATFEQRFRREAHVAARLNDPHVVPIHGYGEIDGRLYVDMRLIAGRDLASVLEESGAMNPVRAVGIIEQVADALDAAHAIDLVHRDIKPSNILLGRRDFVYLIDFGIAQDVNATRLTRTGAAIGTFAYMAPERLDTGETGPSSDIYSLACVLYECLTGQLPFPGDSMQQQIAGHLSKTPPRPSAVTAGVSPAFDEVIAHGMAKEPGLRYPTVIALAEAARGALERVPEETPPPVAPSPGAPTQVAATQQAVPVPGPPPGQEPTSLAPAPPSPERRDEPARVREAPRAQESRPGNFVAPGILLVVVFAFGIGYAILKIMFGLNTNYNVIRLSVFFNLVLWLLLALAFGLVAGRCRGNERAVAVTASMTCAGAVLGALPWGIMLLTNGIAAFWCWLAYLTFCALIAFGVASLPPFGWWWAVSAAAAGLLNIALYVFYPAYAFGPRYFYTTLYGYHYVPMSFLISMLWLIPLFVLGIAMCRTRVANALP